MNAEHIQRTAAEWLAKRTGGNWTQQDEAEFDVWIDADIAHRIQYVRIEAAWHHTARLKALGAGISAGAIPPRNSWGDTRYYRGNVDLESEPAEEAAHEPGSTQGAALTDVAELVSEPPATRTPKRFRYLALAASALLCVLASGYAYFNYVEASHYTTAIGATDTVPLQDGSHITLNTDTSIHVDLGSKERHIELDKGEAYFEVAKDPHRPFIVQAGNKRIVAVGTKFSVRVIPAHTPSTSKSIGDEGAAADIQVAVMEGKVRLEEVSELSLISEPQLHERHATRGSAGAGPVFLAAGAIARTTTTRVVVDQNAVVDPEKLLSWRAGYITFDNIPLADAVTELNRYNTRKITIQDSAIANIHIGGSFRVTNTDAFLELLHRRHSIIVEREADNVILKVR